MNLQKNKETLKDKAKKLSELFWENELEWSKWLRMGVTEHEAIKLSPKYQEKWVRLVDAEEEIKKLQEKSDYYSHMYGKIALERDSLKKTMGQIREHVKNLNDWFVWYIYETTSSIKSVVFGYGNLVDSDNEIMDLILTLEELVGLFQEPKKEAKTE